MLNKLQMQIRSYERRYGVDHANLDSMDGEQLAAYLTDLRRKYQRHVENENSTDVAELQKQSPEVNEAIASRSEIEREKSEERTAIMECDGGLWSNIVLNDMLDDAAGPESLDSDAPQSPSGNNATIAAAPGIQEVEAQERELDELLLKLRRVNRHWKIEWAKRQGVPMKALLHAANFWLSDDLDDWTAANDTIFAFTSRFGDRQLHFRRSEKVAIPNI